VTAAISLEGVSKSLSGSYYLPLVGVSIDYYPLIFVGLILLLSGGCYLCSRGLTKEKVVLSSKG
jgi:hypothetical protein